MELLEGDIIFFSLFLFIYLAAWFLNFSILGNLLKLSTNEKITTQQQQQQQQQPINTPVLLQVKLSPKV